MKQTSIESYLVSNFDSKCEKFCNLLLKYNGTHNITGAKNRAQVYKNIADSIEPLKFLQLENVIQAMDVGTGAGFPGFILAMALPDIDFILVEPMKKRSAFLLLAKSSLQLNNVNIISSRVEDAQSTPVDLITSRAVTDTQTLLNLCKNFLHKNTQVLFYKGERAQEEAKNLSNYHIHKNGKRHYLYIKDIHAA